VAAVAGLALWATVAAAAPGSAPAAASSLIAAGDSALAHLDLRAATEAYRQARRSAPASYEAAWKLARARVDQATLSADRADQKRLCQEADTLAHAAVALDSTDSKGHAYLAIALGRLALFEGGKRKVVLSRIVKAEAERALALNPREDLAHHVLGVWNREVVGLSGVLKFFARILYGKIPDASLDAALDHLRQAAALRPDVIPHRVELGITLAAGKRYREARGELEAALAMPTGWVTDDYYRAKARAALVDVRRHLK
jgi:tetratricopeptide (TPR) repeat protein